MARGPTPGMDELPHTLLEWTADLGRRMAKVDDPSSLRGIILRRQIGFNRAVLRLGDGRRGR